MCKVGGTTWRATPVCLLGWHRRAARSPNPQRVERSGRGVCRTPCPPHRPPPAVDPPSRRRTPGHRAPTALHSGAQVALNAWPHGAADWCRDDRHGRWSGGRGAAVGRGGGAKEHACCGRGKSVDERPQAIPALTVRMPHPHGGSGLPARHWLARGRRCGMRPLPAGAAAGSRHTLGGVFSAKQAGRATTSGRKATPAPSRSAHRIPAAARGFWHGTGWCAGGNSTVTRVGTNVLE